jgi:hypothetical protein
MTEKTELELKREGIRKCAGMAILDYIREHPNGQLHIRYENNLDDK